VPELRAQIIKGLRKRRKELGYYREH